MIERKLKMDNELEDSIFLFGARQTGKVLNPHWRITIIAGQT